MGKMGNGIDETNLSYLGSKIWNKCLNTFMLCGGGDLLWENPSPTSAFTEQTITLQDMSKYKYIILGWQPAPTGNATQYFTFKYNLSVGDRTSIPLGFIDDSGDVCHRKLKVLTNTSIKVENGIVGASSVNNTRCVPIVIYGTNDLGYISGNVDLTEAQADFVKDEYDKTLNLFNSNSWTSNRAINVSYSFNNSEINFSNISGSDPYSYMNFNCLEIGKTYTIKLYSNQTLQYWTITNNGVDSSHFGNNDSYTFVAGATSFELGVEFTSGYTTCNVKVMLNEGNQALPYQTYNGEIVHQKNIEKVLLWTNATPNSEYSATTISDLDLSNFKYIIMGYKTNTGADEATMYKKIKIGTGLYFQIEEHITGNNNVYSREFQFVSGGVRVLSGYYNAGTSYDNAIIPVAIYGTNQL